MSMRIETLAEELAKPEDGEAARGALDARWTRRAVT